MNTWEWFKISSAVVGAPVLCFLLLCATQKCIFTATCSLAGWKCQYAFGAQSGMAEAMEGLISSNGNSDIKVEPKKTK